MNFDGVVKVAGLVPRAHFVVAKRALYGIVPVDEVPLCHGLGFPYVHAPEAVAEMMILR